MASPSSSFETLLRGYLDATQPWSADQDRALRSAVRGSDEAAEAYDRAVTTHRLLVGADPDLPSGFEQARMMDVLLAGPDISGLIPVPSLFERVRGWLLPLGGVAVAVAAVVIFVSTGSLERIVPTEEYVGARGQDFELSVGLGISGVTEDSREYEALAGESTLFFDDYLRIYLTRVIDTHPHALVLGLQAGRAPVWYGPDPAQGDERSLAVGLGRSIPLGGAADPVEFRLSGGRHVVGPLTIVAVFTEAPLGVAEVAAALEARSTSEREDVEAALRGVAGIGPNGIIRMLEARIVPGSREDR